VVESDYGGSLHAYDASNLANEIYNTQMNRSRDVLGSFVRFSVPTIANGRVYVGTGAALVVFGLLNQPSATTVVNAASLQPGAMAPGSLITIFGSNLANGAIVAPTGRLPRSLGGLTLSNVRRGVTQAAVFGYWIGKPFTGQGFMTEAVRAAVGYGFETLHLHRLEAATMPNNVASIRVLERNGFRREGYARRLLKINGFLASVMTSIEDRPEVQMISATFLVIRCPLSMMISPARSLLAG